MPEILDRCNATLLVSTYHANRLLVTQVAGDELTLHLLERDRPMGIACRDDVLAVAEMTSISGFRDHLHTATPPADGQFRPLWQHVTGDVMIHELVYCDAELWFVNTRFSCLATLDRRHSFRPQWRPPFVSALTPDDRCHLNGVAVRDGQPSFVSCFADTDTSEGWRDAPAKSGLILDVATGEPAITGLHKPHSPRWMGGRLWFLDSAMGTFNCADPARDDVDTVVRLPGFTRGLAFVDELAFIGVSRGRDMPGFDEDGDCGVWVVDTTSGAIEAHLRFTGPVRELFDVQIMRGRKNSGVDADLEPMANSFVISPMPV